MTDSPPPNAERPGGPLSDALDRMEFVGELLSGPRRKAAFIADLALIRAELDTPASAASVGGDSVGVGGWQDRIGLLERRAAAVTRWLELHQPDVFRRGLWDAVHLADDAPSWKAAAERVEALETTASRPAPAVTPVALTWQYFTRSSLNGRTVWADCDDEEAAKAMQREGFDIRCITVHGPAAPEAAVSVVTDAQLHAALHVATYKGQPIADWLLGGGDEEAPIMRAALEAAARVTRLRASGQEGAG